MAIETYVSQVTVDVLTFQPIVVLRAAQNQRQIPIRVGASEARHIDLLHRKSKYLTRNSQDLFFDLIDQFDGKILAIALEENGVSGTLNAYFKMSLAGKETILDCKPSEAITIAVKTGMPMWLSAPSLGASTSFADDEVDRDAFKSFVSELKASDFRLQ